MDRKRERGEQESLAQTDVVPSNLGPYGFYKSTTIQASVLLSYTWSGALVWNPKESIDSVWLCQGYGMSGSAGTASFTANLFQNATSGLVTPTFTSQVPLYIPMFTQLAYPTAGVTQTIAALQASTGGTINVRSSSTSTSTTGLTGTLSTFTACDYLFTAGSTSIAQALRNSVPSSTGRSNIPAQDGATVKSYPVLNGEFGPVSVAGITDSNYNGKSVNQPSWTTSLERCVEQPLSAELIFSDDGLFNGRWLWMSPAFSLTGLTLPSEQIVNPALQIPFGNTPSYTFALTVRPAGVAPSGVVGTVHVIDVFAYVNSSGVLVPVIVKTDVPVSYCGSALDETTGDTQGGRDSTTLTPKMQTPPLTIPVKQFSWIGCAIMGTKGFPLTGVDSLRLQRVIVHSPSMSSPSRTGPIHVISWDNLSANQELVVSGEAGYFFRPTSDGAGFTTNDGAIGRRVSGAAVEKKVLCEVLNA